MSLYNKFTVWSTVKITNHQFLKLSMNMRLFEIFLFLNANLVFGIAMKNRRSPIDDFLKDVFVENSAKVQTTFANDPKPSPNKNNFQAAVDELIDACRKNYDVEYCFQTVLGPNYF